MLDSEGHSGESICEGKVEKRNDASIRCSKDESETSKARGRTVVVESLRRRSVQSGGEDLNAVEEGRGVKVSGSKEEGEGGERGDETNTVLLGVGSIQTR